LLSLPVEPFRYYQYGERTLRLDGRVEVEAAYYSAPPGWIGRARVQVQWDVRQVRHAARHDATARSNRQDRLANRHALSRHAP
jgi:hypothetical protein